jgi:ABC-2 type transport system ATP-binding protein
MTPLATTTQVSRNFGDVVAVDEVSLQVHPGEIVGLLGANGAGKTTLIRLLLGLLSPTNGKVALFGQPPGPQARSRLGYMPQGLGLYDDLTVAENLRFISSVFGVEVPAVPDLVRVSDVLVADLPLGIRRRTAFAAAISHRPELLILDEPTSGVGPLARAELWDTIHAAADSGAAVLVSTHYMDEAEQCDRLTVMASGRGVAAGTVDDIKHDFETLVVSTSQPARALDLLEEGGFFPLPAGHRLRVPAGGEARVKQLLEGVDPAAELSAEPATLEEAFMVLSQRSVGT